MRFMCTMLVCCLCAGSALAEKPVHESQGVLRIPCELNLVTYDWDFAAGDQGFTTAGCDDGGGAVWEHGTTTYITGAPGTVWGTVLEADYPTDAGQAIVSPFFLVGDETNLMEIHHYFDAENLWDGGNVTVNGQVIPPIAGYPGIISVPDGWYAWCVNFEAGFTGLDSGWVTSCFDLSSFAGETIQVAFEFGSDNTFVEAGWYVASVQVGADIGVPVESRDWSAIKGLYR